MLNVFIYSTWPQPWLKDCAQLSVRNVNTLATTRPTGWSYSFDFWGLGSQRDPHTPTVTFSFTGCDGRFGGISF